MSAIEMAVVDDEAMWFGANAVGRELWNGRIDELALLDKPLSQTEITELYRIASEEVAQSR